MRTFRPNDKGKGFKVLEGIAPDQPLTTDDKPIAVACRVEAALIWPSPLAAGYLLVAAEGWPPAGSVYPVQEETLKDVAGVAEALGRIRAAGVKRVYIDETSLETWIMALARSSREEVKRPDLIEVPVSPLDLIHLQGLIRASRLNLPLDKLATLEANLASFLSANTTPAVLEARLRDGQLPGLVALGRIVGRWAVLPWEEARPVEAVQARVSDEMVGF